VPRGHEGRHQHCVGALDVVFRNHRLHGPIIGQTTLRPIMIVMISVVQHLGDVDRFLLLGLDREKVLIGPTLHHVLLLLRHGARCDLLIIELKATWLAKLWYIIL
jgi:hypothetical protein